MHLRFVMHNIKLPGASEIQYSSLRNTEFQEKEFIKSAQNEEKHLRIDKLLWEI